MLRRKFLKKTGFMAGGIMTGPAFVSGFEKLKNKTILVVSGWQYHNIGDIAHTPGLLNLLNTFLPQTNIILWPGHEVKAIDAMLLKAFPDLEIVYGKVIDGKVDSPEVQKAAQQADFLLHGSGPSIVGAKKISWWKNHTGKPYGIYGVTVGAVNDTYREIIDNAEFIFTRETQSLHILKEADLKCKTMAFGPDATFAMHLHDERNGIRFMQENNLENKKFICVIPRLRKTPYYNIYPEWNWSSGRINEIDTLNNLHKEEDHAKAREAIVTWVRQTGNKVLVCPEMTYQLDIMDELLIDPLPTDVKARVVKRESYWLCDEAATVYKHAFAVLSFECHSPIMACFNGTPAFYLRQPEDTIKGQMWYDIGLDDWVFEIEEATGEDISTELMKIHNDYIYAKKYLENTMDGIRNVQYKNMNKIRSIINNHY